MNARSENLTRLADHWMCELPGAFTRLYEAFEYPHVGVCGFSPLDRLLSDSDRWRGMLPQFLPFGWDEEENAFGFLAHPTVGVHEMPVLCWDHEYDFYRPVASSFEAFLRWCLIRMRHETDDNLGDNPFLSAELYLDEFCTIVGMDAGFARMPTPRNTTEMHEQVCALDPQAADALNHLGCRHLGMGSVERARDFFVRASEAAPWFADPYFLLADTYAQAGRPGEAVQRFRRVLDCPIALSTRTGLYDLGPGRGDSEISEVAARACASYGGPYEDDPVVRFLRTRSDAFEPEARMELAAQFWDSGDERGAEREYLNALTLATERLALGCAYRALIKMYESTGRHRDAERCRLDAEIPE